MQTSPARHDTFAHGLFTHTPPAHDCPSGQRTPAHGSGGSQNTLHAYPSGHVSVEHGRRATQRFCDGSQKLPDGHTTPRQGTSKQPGTQRPSMQVWPLAHSTCAQGSITRTQAARQVVPAPHVAAERRHGLVAQLPPRQSSPRAQSSLRTHPPGARSGGGAWTSSAGGTSISATSGGGGTPSSRGGPRSGGGGARSSATGTSPPASGGGGVGG